MSTHNPRKHAHGLKLLVNLSLALMILLSFTGFAAAQEPPPERTASDPYDLWTGEYTDFIPPTPESLEMSQPDGSTFQAQLTPMEIGGQKETQDGYTILQDEGGWWVYAQPGDSPGSLVASSLVVGRDLPNGLAKQLGRTPSIWDDGQGNDKRAGMFEAVRDVSSPNNSVFTAASATVKIYRYVVLLVEFQDVKFQPGITPQWVQDQISELGKSPTGSVTDFYYENSYGQFIPYFDVYGPYTSDYNMAWYDNMAAGGHSVSWMINNDIGVKAAPDINWDMYDNDRVVYTSSGVQYQSVDMTVVIHAGPGQEATGQPGQIWSHASTANFTTGQISTEGKPLRIRAVNTCPEIGFNIGVVAHEMGHSIGESDYYDTSYRSMGTGDWDLMAGGSWLGDEPAGSNPPHMNPFSKINQGWIQPMVVTGTTWGVELRPRSLYPDLVMIPLGGSGNGTVGAEERLYIEYISNRVAGAIFDKSALASGLLIWHYDRGGSQTKPTTRPARYRLDVVEYDFNDGIQELEVNLNRGEPTDPWTDSALGVTPYTTPSTNRNTPLVAGGTQVTGWSLANISPLSPVMTLDLLAAPDAAGVLGVGRPSLLAQPVIFGTGPAQLSAKIFNLTSSQLDNVLVQFFATVGGSQVLIAESAGNSIPAGAPTSVIAPWAQPFAGKFVLTAKATWGNDVAEEDGMLRVFERPAPVLIVDDDDGYGAEEAYEGVLTSLGVPYTLVEHTAPLSTLSQYELIIWEAGQAGRMQGQLNLQEIADLKAYLNAGGKLWMSSPRLAAALASTGSAPGVDIPFLRDYFGAFYPMSNQLGGGTIYGLGQYIGGSDSYQLRTFPGRAIQDFLQPAVSTIGSATMLFSWSYGDFLGTEVIGDAAHNNFHVVYFGFNLSQVISGADRLLLSQQVLDQMGIHAVYFDKNTYLMQTSGAVKVTVHDPGAGAPFTALVTSNAQPAGIPVTLMPIKAPGTFTGVLNIQKTGSKGNGLKVNETDTLHVAYTDSLGKLIWDTAAVLLKVDADKPATVHHDSIFTATDAKDLPVMAVVTDDIRLQQVELFYRMAGSNAFTRLVMNQTFKDAFTAVIPASAVTPLGVEYYVVARDSQGNLTFHATPQEPVFVVIQPRTLGQ